MNAESSALPSSTIVLPAYNRNLFPNLRWGSIIAGAIAATAIHMILSALGAGAGLAAFAPLNDPDPAQSFSTGAAIIWSVCALIALGFGGLIAGRLACRCRDGEGADASNDDGGGQPRRDAHGDVVGGGSGRDLADGAVGKLDFNLLAHNGICTSIFALEAGHQFERY